MNTSAAQTKPNVLLLFVLAAVAGILGGIVLIFLGDLVRYPPELEAALGNPNASVDRVEKRAWDLHILYSNLAYCGMATGAILGICFAVAGRKSPAGWAIGAVLGVIGGALGGLAGAGLWQVLVDNKIPDTVGGDTSTHAALAICATWFFLGAVSAIAYGGPKDCVVGGVGGILGALLFIMVVMILLTSVRTNLPIPEKMLGTPWGLARILWGLLPPLVIAGLLLKAGDGSQTVATDDVIAEADPQSDS